MAGIETLTAEPTEAIAGDTLKWEVSYSDFPASAWTLAYTLIGRFGSHDITATADGDAFSVTVAAATTAKWAPNDDYRLVGRVTAGAEAQIVYNQPFTVKADFAEQGEGFDHRSHARRMLDAIEAVMENRATVDQNSYAIGARSLVRMPIADLLAWRNHYRAEVLKERRADQRAAGRGHRGRILTKFVR